MEKYEGNTKWSISKSCPLESKIHALSHNTKLLDPLPPLLSSRIWSSLNIFNSLKFSFLTGNIGYITYSYYLQLL